MKLDKPLEEVWKVKDQIYEEIKHLKLKEQLETLAKKAEETRKRLGYKIEKPRTSVR